MHVYLYDYSTFVRTSLIYSPREWGNFGKVRTFLWSSVFETPFKGYLRVGLGSKVMVRVRVDLRQLGAGEWKSVSQCSRKDRTTVWCVYVYMCAYEFLSWTLTPGSPWSPTNGERPPRFFFSPVRWNTAGRLPYHYHVISITLLMHSLAHCLRMWYQLIERFNPQSAPCFPPHSLPPAVHSRCVFHPSKADVIEVEHWIYQLNEITQTLPDQPGPQTYTFRELLLWNLVALHPIQKF